MNYHSKIIDMMLNPDEAVYKTSAIERDYLKPNIRQLHAVMCFAFCFGQICKGSSSKPPAPRPPIENPPKPPEKKKRKKKTGNEYVLVHYFVTPDRPKPRREA